MGETGRRLSGLTAGDVMTRDVVQLPEELPLREAAAVLRRAQVNGAPVVNKEGRCVGVLSAADFMRWAEGGSLPAGQVSMPACPFQVKGRTLAGEEALICTLGEGNCPLQVMRPMTGGRHIAVCMQCPGAPGQPHQEPSDLPGGPVRDFMTADVVTAAPQTPLPKLAQMMIDAHIHRIIVVDAERRPIGVVSSTDLLAALACSVA